jgi:hypothetical protein
MKRSDWLAALTAALVGLAVLPATALAAPDLAEICHLSSDAAPDEREWIRISVSGRGLDVHLAHGDVLPGDDVNGSDGATTLDENCVPGPTEDPPAPPPGPDDSPGDPEVVFAIAYSDNDVSDDGYNADVDMLIAKLVDGPGAAADGVPGPGDLIVSNQYPKDFAVTDFDSFIVTEHTVTEINTVRDYACNVSSGSNHFVWSSGQGDFDQYEEWTSDGASTRLFDRRSTAPISDDEISANPASPSQPVGALSLAGSAAAENHPFIDVQADCLP